MKEAVVLVLLSVLIVGGIGIWISNTGSIPFFSSQPGAQPASGVQGSDAAKETPPPTPAKKPATNVAKRARVQPGAETPPEPVVIAPVAEVVFAPPAPPVPKQFPEPREIPTGTGRDNVAERFGQPALTTTTTSDDGRVMETLVYSRKSGRDVTVIRIEDGKVLSVYSR